MTESSRSPRPSSSVDHVGDVIDGVKRYARQETVEPLKGAVRWVAVGTTGALSLGMAIVFLSLAVLRLMQDVGGSALSAGWSFVPYLVTVIVLGAVVALAFSRISRDSLRKEG